MDVVGLVLMYVIVVLHFVYYPEIKQIRKDLASVKDYFEAEGDPLDGEK